MAKPNAKEIWRTFGGEAGQFRAEPRPKKTKRSVARNSARTARVKATERSSHIMDDNCADQTGLKPIVTLFLFNDDIISWKDGGIKSVCMCGCRHRERERGINMCVCVCVSLPAEQVKVI